MRPLDPVLESDLTPGSNVKGDVPGANWRFLLDEPAFDRVLFVGSPSKAALRGLSGGLATRPSIRKARWSRDGRLDLPDRSIDLVVVPGLGQVARLARDARRRAELVRVATPAAPVVLEGHAITFTGLVERLAKGLERRGTAEFFVTPHRGEIETAIPAASANVLAWFRDRGHLQPSVDKRDLARLASTIRARTSRGPRRETALGREPGAKQRGGNAARGGGSGAARGRLRHLVAAALTAGASVERVVDRVVPGVRRSLVVLRRAATGDPVPPPAYLTEIASRAGVHVSGWDWGVAAGAEYASQKVLLPLFAPRTTQPGYLVKLTREPAYAPRLERAADALERLAALGIADGTATPRVAFRGRAADVAVVAETAIQGRSFRAAFKARADASDHGLAEEVVRWLAELGMRSRTTNTARDDIKAALEALVDRYAERYRPDEAREAFLRRTILAPSVAATLPLVLQHGDPGPQNLLVTDDDRVGVLDWENADPVGLPLADVIYFLWTYAVLDGTARGRRDPVAAALPQLLDGSALTAFFARSVEAHRQAIGLETALLGPLFYASWVYQALKEAARLPADRLADGIYARVLEACAARPDAPGLRAFFPSPD